MDTIQKALDRLWVTKAKAVIVEKANGNFLYPSGDIADAYKDGVRTLDDLSATLGTIVTDLIRDQNELFRNFNAAAKSQNYQLQGIIMLALHDISIKILEKQREKMSVAVGIKELVFRLPTANGANKVLSEWILKDGIEKHVTWSCARLSFLILLQDERINEAAVACPIGHTVSAKVRKIYKRRRPRPHTDALNVVTVSC